MTFSSKPVFKLSSTCAIDAPASEAYRLLTDLSTWPDWNPFVPSAKVLSGPDQSSSLSSLKTLREGQRVKFNVVMPFFGKIRRLPGGSIEKVALLGQSGPFKYQAIWVQDGIPNFLLRTTRVNELEDIAGEEGSKCVYTTSQTLSGPLAWLVKVFVGSKVQDGIQKWAEGLKIAAERSTTDPWADHT